MPDPAVRVRFAPSPTGELHVGNVRTALYNWAFARHQDGVFLLRIEDTDPSRSTDEAAAGVVDDLRWLGLEWDEGPDVGGPVGPYRQSERLDLYAEWTARFLADGAAYHCYCRPEEVAERNAAAGRPPGYDNHCRELTGSELAGYRGEGRQPVVRLRMPPGRTTFDDMVRGEVHFDHAHVPDFVLVRADGRPLYTLAVAVDDVLMRVSHVLRGEDLLSSTPRQLAVYAAMGVPPADCPRFGHLPFVMGQDNAKLSKRHGEVSINWYRRNGFLPEAMANYLALLGWSPGEDREVFGLAELARSFTVARVNRNPARFDLRKLEALNGEHLRLLGTERLVAELARVLSDAHLLAAPPTAEQHALVARVAPLLQTRLRRLTDAPGMVGFLFVDDEHFTRDEVDRARTLIPSAAPVLQTALDALGGCAEWIEPQIQRLLRSALDGRGLTTKEAFPVLYVAVAGRRSGPPLYDSLELLGRERVLSRLQGALSVAVGSAAGPGVPG